MKDNNSQVEKVSEFVSFVKKAIYTVFSGEEDAVNFSILGLISSLHVLIEDVPGVGKTTLARSLSQAVGLSFSRIQFTPDMLPSDVLGMNVWNPIKNEFHFKPGAINAQCILADELNRTSPRTQSAFLEAMQEEQVTIDGITRFLPKPFFLIATQNPQTFAGTFPLPEAELDRFGLSFSIGYPSKEDELSILKKTQDRTIKENSSSKESFIQSVADEKTILEIRNIVDNVFISDAVLGYIVDIVRETRKDEHIKLGASPRSCVFLQKASKAQAAVNSRNYVLPEDVLAVCHVVLSHRIVLSPSARLENLDSTQVIKNICKRLPIPTGL